MATYLRPSRNEKLDIFTLQSCNKCTRKCAARLFCSLRACLHGGGGPQIGEVTCGGSSHLSCKRDQIKMRDYVDRLVTPP